MKWIGPLLILLGAHAAAGADFRFIMNSDFYVQGRSLPDSSVNPNNQVFKFPSALGVIDLKPDFSILGESAKFVFRPRWTFTSLSWNAGEYRKGERTEEGSGDITDLFLEADLSRKWRFIGGLEVYQWGPTEFFNVSNPLYNLSPAARSPFFKEKGQVLVRISYDYNENWNNMLIVNPAHNNERPWRADDKFEEKFLLKTEYRNRVGSFYAGALAGQENDRLPFVGEYANLSFDSGISIYGEARHTRGDYSYYPLRNQLGFVEMTQDEDSETWVHQSIFGIRYEGGIDARAEVILNSNGYTRKDFENAIESVTTLSPYLAENYKRFLQPGMQLYGQAYLYLSVRIAEMGRKGDTTIFFRGLNSYQDGSGTFQFALDTPIGDSFTFLFDATQAYGGKDKELTFADHFIAAAGLRWTL